MRMFPLFVNIEGKRVILFGKGCELSDKLEKIRPYRADIEVYTEDALEEDGVRVHRGEPGCGALTPPPVFVLIAGAGREETKRLSGMCMEMGIPVNAADEPENCSFFFPSLVTKGSLTVAVSTGGKSPAAAAALRRRIEEQIPSEMEEILDWAQAARERLKEAGTPPPVRRQAMKRAVLCAMEKDRPLTDAETDEIIRDTQNG